MKSLRSATDFVSYVSELDPGQVEIFEFTTEEENLALFNSFKESFNIIVNVIDDPSTKVAVELIDSYYIGNSYSIKYENAQDELYVYVILGHLDVSLNYVGGFRLNGEEEVVFGDAQLWDEITSKSHQRYFESLN